MSTHDSSFDLIYFVDWRVQYLCNGRCLDRLRLTELHKFAASACNEQHIIYSIDTAHLRYKLDIQGIDSFRKGKVDRRQPPFTRNILDRTEVIGQSLGPEFSVSGHTYLEVRLDKGIGCALRITLRSERESEIPVGNGNVAYGQICRSRTEENIVLSRAVIERQFALGRLVRAAGNALEFVCHCGSTAALTVFPSFELVKIRPLSSVTEGLRRKISIEVVVVYGSVRNVFLRDTVVLHLDRDGVHICLIGTEQPSGNCDIMFRILCPELFGHIIQTSHHRTPFYLKICIIA